MPQPYKLLVTDVDGTLLDDDGQVSDETREAVRGLADRGIPVALCTGRSIMACRKIIERLGLRDQHHIFYDGALVGNVSGKDAVRAVYLDIELIREMVEFSAENGIDLELAALHGSFSERETWSSQIKVNVFGHPVAIGPLRGIWERERIIRASLTVREPGDKEKAELFTTRFRDDLVVSPAHSPEFPDVVWLNLLTPGLSKGQAVKALAKHLGITTDEVVAAGDWLNDIPMMRAAGMAVAMGNAHEDVKALADFVTLTAAEHGLAHAIRRLFP
jgi:Cof subfamily protein (haloacid dehalogenase superfamily)